MDKKDTYNIILTFIVTVGILQILNIFIPVALFKGSSIMIYSFTLLLILLSGGVAFSLYDNVSDYMYLAYYVMTNVLPIVILLYTNIRYVNTIENKNIKLEQYNTLLTIFIVIYISQLIILYNSYHNEYGLNKLFIGNACISLFNLFISGLIWREISFYVTDG